MTTMQLDVDLAVMVQEAVMAKITPESRDELIRGALAQLLAGGTNSYDKRSQLQQIFDRAAINAAERLIAPMLESDAEFAKNLKEMIVEASTRLYGVNREKVVEKMAAAMEKAIIGDRY